MYDVPLDNAPRPGTQPYPICLDFRGVMEYEVAENTHLGWCPMPLATELPTF